MSRLFARDESRRPLRKLRAWAISVSRPSLSPRRSQFMPKAWPSLASSGTPDSRSRYFQLIPRGGRSCFMTAPSTLGLASTNCAVTPYLYQQSCHECQTTRGHLATIWSPKTHLENCHAYGRKVHAHTVMRSVSCSVRRCRSNPRNPSDRHPQSHRWQSCKRSCTDPILPHHAAPPHHALQRRTFPDPR